MVKKREVVYMVNYKDDDNKKHISFVKGYSQVKFLEDRFGTVKFERTEIYDKVRSELGYI